MCWVNSLLEFWEEYYKTYADAIYYSSFTFQIEETIAENHSDVTCYIMVGALLQNYRLTAQFDGSIGELYRI